MHWNLSNINVTTQIQYSHRHESIGHCAYTSECAANSEMMTDMGKTDLGCSEEKLFKWHLVQHEGLGGEKKRRRRPNYGTAQCTNIITIL
jgi:hypothetical protein